MHPAVRQVVMGRHFNLSRLFASASGFDFTDLDVTKTWGADGFPLFRQDTTGTLVTASGQSVGSVLDKSQGLALGAELVTGGDFASSTGWNLGTNWAISGGKATHTAGAQGDLNRAITLAAGLMARAKITVSGRTAGSVQFKQPFSTSGDPASANADYLRADVATIANVAGVTGLSAFDGSIDDFSVKQILGNGAVQSSSSARPTWQANSGKPYLSFDGSDDNLPSTLVPAASMTLAFCGQSTVVNTAFMGSNDGASHRCFIGLNSSGQLAGGIGGDSNGTICGGAAVTSTNIVGLLRANGTTVELWLNGTRIYQAAQNGTCANAIPMMLGAQNLSGTGVQFIGGRIYSAVAVQSYIADSDVLPLMRLLGATAGLSF